MPDDNDDGKVKNEDGETLEPIETSDGPSESDLDYLTGQGGDDTSGEDGGDEKSSDKILDSDKPLVDVLKEKGGDGEGLVDDREQMQDLDPDSAIDDPRTRATDEVIVGEDSDASEAPTEETSDDSETEQPRTEESDVDEDQGEVPELPEGVSLEDLDKDTIEKAQNLDKWQTTLTERAKKLSDLETLEKMRRVAAQDPARVEAFEQFFSDLQEGKFDSGAKLDEIEQTEVEIPEEAKGTEYEDFFKQQQEKVQTLTSELRKQVEMNKRLRQQMGQQVQQSQQPQKEDDFAGVGESQDSAATGRLPQEGIEEHDKFLEEHPELVDEQGEPTESLNEIYRLMKDAGGALDWEQAYYSVVGDQLEQDALTSDNSTSTEETQEETTQASESNGQLTSGSDQSDVSDTVGKLLGSNESGETIKDALERRM